MARWWCDRSCEAKSAPLSLSLHSAAARSPGPEVLGGGLAELVGRPMVRVGSGYIGLTRHESGLQAWAWAVVAARELARHGMVRWPG